MAGETPHGQDSRRGAATTCAGKRGVFPFIQRRPEETPVAYTSILLDIDPATHVATLTLNRPDKLNSFTRSMHAELRDALDAIERDGTRALVLTGAGRAFCAGQDLADLDFTPGCATDLGNLIDENFNPLVRRLQALPLPVIAAVNGTAAGAGANLALACDLTLAARSSTFIQAFVKIGLVPDTGGTWSLPRRIGMARALGLAITGDKLTAEKAESWGMIWRVVDDAQLASEAGKLAAELAQQPTRAIAAIKRAIRAGATQDLDAQLDLERDLQRELGASHDYAEGVHAFIEKRAPHFKGS
jgi:2-(1,2-epoxy-1,2-dihydrophenyl)acetyl-CoA isomerase